MSERKNLSGIYGYENKFKALPGDDTGLTSHFICMNFHAFQAGDVPHKMMEHPAVITAWCLFQP
jgi:hypothetical protein